MAIVGIGGQQQLVAQELRAGEIHEIEKILGEVRRVGRRTAVGQHAKRGCTVAVQVGIRIGVAQVDVGLVVLPAHLAESLIDPGRRHVAPARLVEVAAGQEVIKWAGLPAGLPLERAPPEGAPIGLELRARIVMATLGLHRQGSAQGIESEHRVGAGHERHGGNGRLRNQIPVDGVAEGLVHAHTVDIDRQALGCAQERRGGESVVIDVELKGVIRALADVDAAEVIV